MIGLQLGAQSLSQLVFFMNNKVLGKFCNSKGSEAGVDGSVALATLGAGGAIENEDKSTPLCGTEQKPYRRPSIML